MFRKACCYSPKMENGNLPVCRLLAESGACPLSFYPAEPAEFPGCVERALLSNKMKPAKAQQQKTPVKQQTPATPLTNGKRKAEPGGESPAKKLRLEDHIPASFVVDYRERDSRDVKVSDLPKGTKVEDLKSICKGCVDIRGKGRPDELLYAFVQYPSAEKAVAAIKKLQATKLKGKSLTVTYCGDKWDSPDNCPTLSYNLVDVRGIPHGFDRSQFASLFPAAKVLKFFADGYAQLKFQTPEDVIKALKNPKCRTLNGKNLQFAMAVHHSNQEVKQKKKAKVDAGATSLKKDKPQQQQQQTPGKPAKGSPKTPNQKQQQQKGAKESSFKETPQPQQAGKGPKTPGAKFTPVSGLDNGEGFIFGDEVNVGHNHLVTRSCRMFSMLLVYALVVLSTDACRTPQVPNNGKISFRLPTKTSPNELSSYTAGMNAVYTCDRNFHLMGPRHRRCHDDGLWYPQSLPFCLSDVTGGLPAVQSSAYKVGGEAFFAVDGDRNTCTSTTVEESPWLAVHLEDVLPIAIIKLNFRYTTKPSAVYVTVRVGDLEEGSDVND
ncbi:hypothetical protein HPB47_000735 [Ixodes persulcatus]|uniref:Uncharacterized protein n=1 Tax=Ixodes persulcatus TaxID=34615 RepID=A0AC60PSY7_IXOPE|nr:hypothetical protein HPB47_000735 [Ixodes persulcatus]